MAKISLRAYNREIDKLISSGLLDEAIAHCRHILKFYAKHVDTYRQLGKAFLEGKRYGDAADILQRVLSSVPDDFLAHLGMSVIREDEGNLEEAVWHMERAYEIQPSLATVKDELRRLQKRRSGAEPPRPHHTRASLTRMYANSDLFQQAIAEGRAALAEQPNRLDLQVLLARVYFQAGMQTEAVDLASTLVRSLPYCVEANRILADVLTRSNRGDEAREYQARLDMLDPYWAYVTPQTPTPERVPEAAISLEKLDYHPDTSQLASQPEWAASLGVQVEGLTPAQENLPDWLEESAAPTAPAADDRSWLAELSAASGEAAPAASPADETASDGAPFQDDLPDWMQAAGWSAGTDTHEPPVPMAASDDFAPEAETPEALAAAEIPAWLREIAPEESAVDDAPAAPAASSREAPDWLQSLDAPEETPHAPQSAATVPSGDLPDWLQSLGASEETPEAAASVSSGDLPDWLQNLDAAEEPPAAPPAAAWLQDLDAPEATPAPADDVPELAPSSEVPDWLQALARPEASAPETGQVAAEVTEFSQALEQPSDELPAWMQTDELAPVPVEPEIAAETAVAEPAVAEPAVAEPAVAEPAVAEPAVAEPAVAEPPAAPPEAADLPDWLQAEQLPEAAAWRDESTPPAGQPSPQDEAETPPLPAWLQALNAGADEPLPEVNVPDWMQPPTPATATPAAAATPSWLSELEAAAPPIEGDTQPTRVHPARDSIPAAPEPSETPGGEAAALPAADLPNWLTDLGDQPAAEAPAAAVAEPEIVTADLPDWLNGLAVEEERSEAAAEEPESEPPAPTQTESVSDWLSALDAAPEAEVPAVAAEPPNWLSALAEEDSGATASAPGEAPEESVSDWLSTLDAAPETEIPAAAAEPPSWLSALATEDAAAEPGLPVEQEPQAASETQPAEQRAAEQRAAEQRAAEQPETPPEALTPSAAPDQMTIPALEDEAGQLLDDLDAFAWLESLAARQGADESLLLVQPDDRLEAPPQWVTDAAAEPDTADSGTPEPPSTPDWLQTSAIEETEISALETPINPWEVPAPEAALEPAAAVEPPAPEPEHAPEPAATVEPSTVEPPAPEPERVPEPAAAVEPSTVEPPAPEPAYADALAAAYPPEPDVHAVVASLSELSVPQAPAASEPVPDLPDWLAGMDAASGTAGEPLWSPEEAAPEPIQQVDPNLASLVDLERLPGVGFILAQALISWRERQGPFTSLRDLLRVPGVSEDTLARVQAHLRFPTPAAPAPVSAAPAAAPVAAPVAPQDAPDLALAAQLLTTGDLKGALEEYDRLIKARRQLPAILETLEAEAPRHPDDVAFLQTLGDVYMRLDRLEDALNTYNRAEDLLR